MAILKDLIVHGSSRFLNKIYAEELETSAFEAESAIIKKLKADELGYQMFKDSCIQTLGQILILLLLMVVFILLPL